MSSPAPSSAFVDPPGFAALARFLREETGVELTPEKAYLVEYRLSPLAGEQGAATLSQLCERLKTPDGAVLRGKVVEAMTTHETLFFRDPAVFARLKEAFAELAVKRAAVKRLRVWSAACSTGQEPYSVAMMLLDLLPDAESWDLRIVATDVAEKTLESARTGVYGVLQVNRGLPTALLLKHFDQQATSWTVKDRVRRLIEFRASNLLREVPPGGPFDLILCRNVLIYFDAPAAQGVLSRARRALVEDGFLVLGGSENLLGRETGYRPAFPTSTSVYRAA